MPKTDSDDPPEPLVVALLLAATGGMLDAFVYLNHGHVFANAMTGNVVLLGVMALTGHWDQTLRHIVPLAAFLAGVTASRSLRSVFGRRSGLAGLIFEMAALTIASFLPPNFPDIAFTATIAFVASCQITSFRHVDGLSYNSTFITGNLRTMIEGLYESLWPSSRESGRKKTRDLGSICLCFLLGVLAGAWLASRSGNHTLWWTLPLLLLAIAAVAAE